MDKAQVIFFLIISTLVIICFISGIIYFIFSFKKRKQMHLIEKEELVAKHKAETLQAQLEVQQQTMDYIGREIHDNVGQKLTLASLLAQQLQLSLKDERINNIINAVDEGLQDLRSLSKSLTISGMQELGFIDLLSIEAKNVELLKKQELVINADAKCNISVPQTKLIVLRIVQEFIQNSLKHANCSKIFITVQQMNNICTIELSDDGIGFDTSKKTNGIGLSNMQKRAALINATFTLSAKLNKGTNLKISFTNNIHEA